MGGRNAKEWTCVQGAVVPKEPGSPPPRESEDESGLRESQQPAPSRTAVELGITPPSASLDPRDVVAEVYAQGESHRGGWPSTGRRWPRLGGGAAGFGWMVDGWMVGGWVDGRIDEWVGGWERV